jgi:hypothetical protein
LLTLICTAYSVSLNPLAWAEMASPLNW